MVTGFELLAIAVSGVAIFREVGRKEAAVVCSCLASFAYINSFNPHQIGVYHYIVVMLIDLIFLYFAARQRINVYISLILLCSIIFNAGSYIEHTTDHSYFYDSYSHVMEMLIVFLIIAVFLTRNEYDDRSNDRTARSFDYYSDSSISSRSTL
jgi:NADH:ubiquinone oxidoreductase subunit 2 (subunit N)